MTSLDRWHYYSLTWLDRFHCTIFFSRSGTPILCNMNFPTGWGKSKDAFVSRTWDGAMLYMLKVPPSQYFLECCAGMWCLVLKSLMCSEMLFRWALHTKILPAYLCVYFDTASYIQPVCIATLHAIRNTHTYTHTHAHTFRTMLANIPGGGLLPHRWGCTMPKVIKVPP